MNLLIKHRWLSAVFLLSAVSHPGMAEEPERTDLTPLQRKQIQTVSQAVLASKRSVKPSSESLVIRNQIKQVRSRLVSLTAPVGSVKLVLDTEPKSSRTITKEARSVAAFSQEDKAQAWRQAHSKSIQQLDSALAQLKGLCDDEIARREPAQLGLLQRLKSRLFRVEAEVVEHKSVVTSLSNAALEQLSNLQTEINDTLALPEQERHQQILALTKRLQISRNPPAPTADEDQHGESGRRQTPTLISRASHRRQF